MWEKDIERGRTYCRFACDNQTLLRSRLRTSLYVVVVIVVNTRELVGWWQWAWSSFKQPRAPPTSYLSSDSRKGKERKEKKITAITTLVFKQPERNQEEEEEEEEEKD